MNTVRGNGPNGATSAESGRGGIFEATDLEQLAKRPVFRQPLEGSETYAYGGAKENIR